MDQGSYFLRRPPITNNAPEISANALPVDAGLISGTAVRPKAMLPTPTNSNTLPNSFTMDLLMTILDILLSQDSLEV